VNLRSAYEKRETMRLERWTSSPHLERRASFHRRSGCRTVLEDPVERLLQSIFIRQPGADWRRIVPPGRRSLWSLQVVPSDACL
jgi:hypothetical protein